MKRKDINTLIGGAALLLVVHLTIACAFCFILGALLMAAMSQDDEE